MRLSYPLEIPPGRVGMQPQLGVSYSSAGGNGWMGLNWSLSIPSVDIQKLYVEFQLLLNPDDNNDSRVGWANTN